MLRELEARQAAVEEWRGRWRREAAARGVAEGAMEELLGELVGFCVGFISDTLPETVSSAFGRKHWPAARAIKFWLPSVLSSNLQPQSQQAFLTSSHCAVTASAQCLLPPASHNNNAQRTHSRPHKNQCNRRSRRAVATL